MKQVMVFTCDPGLCPKTGCQALDRCQVIDLVSLWAPPHASVLRSVPLRPEPPLSDPPKEPTA